MKKLLASNTFWALPEGRAENVLRMLALGQNAKKVPAGDDGPAGAMDLSSDGKAWEPAQPAAPSDAGAAGAVRVIAVDGVLFNGDYDAWFGMGYGYLKREIQAALDDPACRAILLDVNSPGGSVAGCQELAHFVAEAAKRKPMAAYTNSLMASAAYWVGSATGRVLCTQTAEVGSIGVIMTRYDFSGLNEAWGLKVHVISSGRWKAAGHPDTPFTDEEREYFKHQTDGIHAVFRKSVADAMGLTSSAEEWGEAQVFLGADALNVGLASAVVNGLDEAVTMLSQEVTMDRAALEANHPDLVKELLAEGYAKAVTERSFTAESFLSCVKPFMDEGSFAQAKGFFDSGTAAKLTPDQMAAMAAHVVKVEEKKEAKAEGDGGRGAVLEALQKSQSPDVPLDNSKAPAARTAREALMAAAKNQK